MLLICTRPFGNKAPGDEVEVPDGAAFDHAYFELAKPVKDKAPKGAKEGSR